MNNKMAIAAVVVIVVALAAFGTYIIYSDDGADDGIEVPVSQPSVGDFITTKMTEPDGTVWERTYVLTIAEDDMAAEIIVNSYSDKTMWAPYVMDSTDQFYMIVCDSGEGYDLVGTETIDTAFGERACNIYEDANGVRYWICPENGVQYRYVQNGSTCELIGTSLFEGADGLELSQLSDTRSLSEGDYVNMTRYDNNGLTREFYLLVTGVEDGAYQVEYPNGSQSMTEEAFYDRLGAVDQIDGSEFIGESVAFVDGAFVPADLYFDPDQGEYLLVCSDDVCYISINADGASVISNSTIHQEYVPYETDSSDLSPEVGDVLYLTRINGDLNNLAILTDAHSAGIIMMVITSVDGNSLTYEYTNLVTGETTTQTSTVQDFVERMQPGLVKDDASISVRETVYGPRLCYNVRVDNADGTITYYSVGVGSGILYLQQDILADGTVMLNFLSGYTDLGEPDSMGSGSYAVYDNGDGGRMTNVWLFSDTGYYMVAADSDGTVWVFHFDDMGDIEVGGDSDVTDTKTVMGRRWNAPGTRPRIRTAPARRRGTTTGTSCRSSTGSTMPTAPCWSHGTCSTRTPTSAPPESRHNDGAIPRPLPPLAPTSGAGILLYNIVHQ